VKLALRTACLIGLSLGLPTRALAAVDTLEAARQQTGPAPYQSAGTTDVAPTRLQWEPVVGPPYLVAGHGPALRTDSGWRGILLALGQKITIHVPAHALLRVVADDATGVTPAFSISDGNGAAMPLMPVRSTDGSGWLLRSPLSHAALIHVRSAPELAVARRLGFFLGRVDPAPQVLLYRRELSLPGEAVSVRNADEAVARPHARMRAEQEVVLAISGPVRLALDYQVDAGIAVAEARVILDVSVDGDAPTTAQQLTGPTPTAPRSVDGAWNLGARSEHLAIDIPEGEHVLRLKPSHTILSRASVLAEPDFLLPLLNFPSAWKNLAPADALAALEQQSIATAASNSWHDGNLAAAQPLDRAARSHPIVPALRQAADELLQHSSAYRDLAPSSLPEEAATGARAYFFRMLQPPDKPPRHDIRHAKASPAPLPVADFYSLGRASIGFALVERPHPRGLRLLVSNPAGLPRQIELRYDNGDITMLEIGNAVLDEARLRPVGTDVAAALNPAAALPNPLPVTQVATIEWQVPPGVRSLSLRLADMPGKDGAAAAEVLLGLQELRSADYVLDDRFMAQLANDIAPSRPGELLMQDALKPFHRRLAQARRQFVANVSPIDTQADPTDAISSDQAGKAATQVNEAEQAAKAGDSVRALELWAQVARATAPALRIRALSGQAQALLGAGERFAAERLLRGHWIGADPPLVQVAAEELAALYRQEGDLAMQTQFAAARAATDPSAYADLAQAFAAEGEDELALQAGLLAVPRNFPLLMQSALRSQRWDTFDALMAQLGAPQDAAFWRMQRALIEGKIDAARTLAGTAGAAQWTQAMEQARQIAPRLSADIAPEERSGAVNDWLDWQYRHPGPRTLVHEPGLVRHHGGGVVLRNVGLDLSSTWWRSGAGKTLRVRVVGPARLRVEARPLHADDAGLVSGWLRLRSPNQHWLQPFRQNQVAPGLLLEGERLFPGTAVMRDIDIPTGIHNIEIDADTVPIIARVMVERPALAAAGLPAPVAAYFEDRQRLLASMEPAPLCGSGYGCQITVGAADERLQPGRVRIRSVPWLGLTAPSQAENRTAARLAAGDIAGAFESSDDPVEKMGLLLWLAEARPAERAKAVAHGAALAARQPTANVMGLWQHLETQSAWSPLPIVDRSAGLRGVEVAAGTPEAPAGRIRAALLAPLRTGEIRLGSDSRATLWVNRDVPVTLNLELRAEDLPGTVFQPFVAVVERNGREVKRMKFDGDARGRAIRVPLPFGEQQITVRLDAPYANQFARVRFTGLPEAIPRLTRDWHIATLGQPVQITVAGPAWLRVDRHTPTGIGSEQRLVTEPASRLSLPVESGSRETLYRVFLRRAEPEPAAPKPPRPNAYQPEPVPEPPKQWLQAQDATTSKVRFIDSYSLAALADATWSGRFGLHRRQDAETTGGEAEKQVERFAEAGLSWRQRSADGLEFRHADAFVRQHDAGSPLIGFSLALERSIPWTSVWPYPLDVSAALGVVAQNTPDGTGAALAARLALAQERLLSAELSHRPTIEINARALRLDRISDPARVDNDVFTRYRKQHPWALAVSDTVSWRPWRDSHASARAAVVGNPNLNLFQPDNLSLDAQWRQLAGGVIIEAGARVIRFLADDDRANGITRRDLRLGAGWETWLRDGSRVELQAQARRNLTTGVNWGGVELHWHWGAGRGLRDFGAKEIDFRSVRSWRMPAGSMLVEEP